MLIGIDASRTTVARRTGTEAYSLALTQALLALDTTHRWRLYFNQAPPRHEWPHGSNVDLRVIPLRRLWTHARLSLEMFDSPPDVLFVPAHVLPLIRPRRSVVTVHDLGYHYFPDAHTRSARAYLKLSTRWNAACASRILVDSRATRDDLVRLYGAPADKIRVVYPGRNEGIQHVADRERIAALMDTLGIGAPYILYLGTLQPRKNLARLVDAYGRLLANWGEGSQPPALVLAGQRGWLSDDIFRAVERLGLSEQVIFPGYVSDEDLPALLSGARVFAFPSLYEGFGFPVLEAMACHVPVVCANTSSLPEVAGDAAWQVDPLDVDALAAGLHRAWTDNALRRRLVDAGRQQIEKFSWEKCAQQTLSVLEEAAAQ
jgi:glycosyltransferase involved in cell wall biosynthesis